MMMDCWQTKNYIEALEKRLKERDKIKDDLKYYLDTNEENGVVCIPKFVIEKIVYGK